MAIRRRPPVFVVSQTLGPGWPKFQAWRCDSARLQSAKFQDRDDHRRTAVVHPSTKQKGKWQTSFFDQHGAVSDFQSQTCQEAVRELRPSGWRLRAIRAKT